MSAAARSLRLAGVEDFALLELQDHAGGNSRGGTVNGIACPLGAHYLPLPGDDALQVQDLLEELGLRQRVTGRWQYGGDGESHPKLLPVQGVGAATLAQYQRFAALVEAPRRATRFAMPAFTQYQSKQPLAPAQQALDAITFDTWLHQNGLDDAHLRWYLNYCCRDDYGAGSARVSAWAGLHYFASRHGFSAPGSAAEPEDDSGAHQPEGVLTWPEGNGWLTRQLAAPLQAAGLLHPGCSVLRIHEGRHGVEVDAFNHASNQLERWQAQRCIVALPVFVAARVLQNPLIF